MFTLTFSELMNPEFTSSLRKLMNYNGYADTRLAYNVAKIGRKYQQEARTCQDLYIKHIKKFANLDDKGNFVPRMRELLNAKGEKISTPEPDSYTIPPEKMEAFEKATEEFRNTVFEIQCHKVKLADVAGAKLTPNDMNLLEPLLTELEAAPDSKANGAVPPHLKPVANQAPAPTPA